MFDVAWTYLDL